MYKLYILRRICLLLCCSLCMSGCNNNGSSHGEAARVALEKKPMGYEDIKNKLQGKPLSEVIAILGNPDEVCEAELFAVMPQGGGPRPYTCVLVYSTTKINVFIERSATVYAIYKIKE